MALEEQESWFVVLERDWPEEDSDDLTYEVRCCGYSAIPRWFGLIVSLGCSGNVPVEEPAEVSFLIPSENVQGALEHHPNPI